MKILASGQTESRSFQSGPMALKKLRAFVHDRQKLVSAEAARDKLKEEVNIDIADAATVIIGSQLSAVKRQSFSNSFINSVANMTDNGVSILAIAVAFE